MFSLSIDPDTFTELSINRAQNRRLLQALADKSDGGLITRTIAAATHELADLTADEAPFLTGTLRAAHLGEVEDGEGAVFITNAVNPIFGGNPANYSVKVHNLTPWFTNTADREGPAILDRMAEMLIEGMEGIWQ